MVRFSLFEHDNVYIVSSQSGKSYKCMDCEEDKSHPHMSDGARNGSNQQTESISWKRYCGEDSVPVSVFSGALQNASRVPLPTICIVLSMHS